MGAYLEAETFIEDAARSAKLDAIHSSHACEAGRVVVLDFAAIQMKIGQRWAARREDVWTQIERAVHRHGGRDTLHCRLNQTEYLLAFARASGVAAQALGFQILEDMFVHFLGQFSDQDLVVRTVASVGNGDIVTSQPIAKSSRHDLQDAAVASAAATSPATMASGLTLYESGRQLGVRTSLENVFNLKTDKLIGLRLSTTIQDLDSRRVLNLKERNALSTRALLTIDVHVLDTAKALMSRRSELPVFIIPQALQPVGGSQARFTTFERLNGLELHDRLRLVVEMVGIEAGTPTSRVKETLSLIKPFCRIALCRALPSRTCINALNEAHVQGVSVSSRDLGLDGTRLAGELLAFGEAVKKTSLVRVATGLTSQAHVAVCSVAGFTHVTMPAGEP